MRNVKTLYTLALLIGCIGFSAPMLSAQVAFSDLWLYDDVQVEKSQSGRELLVSFKLTPIKGMRSQEVRYIYPAVVSPDQKHVMELDPVAIAGSRRMKVIQRQKRLHNPTHLPQVEFTLPFRSVKQEPLVISQKIPYLRWMKDAKLIVREQIYGCAACEKSETVTELQVASSTTPTTISPFTAEIYSYTFYEPEAVRQKIYYETFESKVNFLPARHDLITGYRNNREELVKLDAFIQRALQIEGATLREVKILGYASPEGEEEYNKVLSKKRATVLSDYVKSKFPVLSRVEKYIVSAMGEDWAGLRRLMQAEGVSYAQEVLHILDNRSSKEAKKSALKRIDNGGAYAYLMEEIFPKLRKTSFDLSYDVRPYTLEEIPQIFATNPALLSHHELFQLAQLREQRGENPLEVYQVAYQRFAAEPIATLNYANALLKYAQEPERAIRLLHTLQADPRAKLPLAIAYHMSGHPEEAERVMGKE